MVETQPLAEVTEERLEEAEVIMAVGVGDRNVSNVLFGRKEFVAAAAHQDTAAKINVLRVEVAGEEELEELKKKAKEAKDELDEGVE